MTLTPEDLKQGFDATLVEHKSIHNPNQKYKLVDFRWKSDNDQPKEKQEELFNA